MTSKDSKGTELVGKFLELSGKVVGQIEADDTKTLLVRKGMITFFGEKQVFLKGRRAVYVDKGLVEAAYWIRLRSLPIVTETVNVVNRGELISEFSDV
ncbi:hypothetical protein [Schleiferilactobacillus perolens]|jgi:hypothetical protein|uniref:hypothetical protein n=1 Tax=Schleiferilactobacillus perolens TaxID=100468 RepID=UPI00235554E0|nr:hypothetical protein [Schleiferilactobacillus perolens]MCI2170647.1 hypothetical protein [Schleiferilactobacillus perolens]